ncbi:MAG: signal peptidase I [Defluviitaleaceae bacterium]|nr:signal peptidase I [Defluviitaleaceae bacterium]
MDENNLNEHKKTEVPNVKSELWREALSWIKTILFALIFAWIFTNFVIVNASVPTGSMEGTIRINDRIVAFRLSYLFSDPQRNNIIVFRGPYENADLYVKRIIGVPGDTITISDWRVYVNGELLEEEYVKSAFEPHSSSFRNFPDPEHPGRGDYITVPEDGSAPFITVPEGHFFVLGDNRDNSVDSRRGMGQNNNLHTFVSQDQIQGKVIFRYFPGFKNLTK